MIAARIGDPTIGIAPAIGDTTARAMLAARSTWRPNELEDDWMEWVPMKTEWSDCVFALAESIVDVGSNLESRVGVGWPGPPTTAFPLGLPHSSLTVSCRRRRSRIAMNLGNSNLNSNLNIGASLKQVRCSGSSRGVVKVSERDGHVHAEGTRTRPDGQSCADDTRLHFPSHVKLLPLDKGLVVIPGGRGDNRR